MSPTYVLVRRRRVAGGLEEPQDVSDMGTDKAVAKALLRSLLLDRQGTVNQGCMSGAYIGPNGFMMHVHLERRRRPPELIR